MPVKTKPLPREIDVSDDALASYGIPKDSTLKLRRRKYIDVSELTVWQTPNGVNVTHAFEDSDNVVFYNSKNENLLDTYPKDEVLRLGTVEKVSIPFTKLGGKIDFDIDEVPTGEVLLYRMKTDNLAHLRAKKDYCLVIDQRPVTIGDFVMIQTRKEDEEGTQTYYFGVYAPYFDDISLDLKNDKPPTIYNTDDVEIVGKVLGFCSTERNYNGNFSLNSLRYY